MIETRQQLFARTQAASAAATTLQTTMASICQAAADAGYLSITHTAASEAERDMCRTMCTNAGLTVTVDVNNPLTLTVTWD